MDRRGSSSWGCDAWPSSPPPRDSTRVWTLVQHAAAAACCCRHTTRWCEHDPLVIWGSVQRCIAAAVEKAEAAAGQPVKASVCKRVWVGQTGFELEACAARTHQAMK